MDIDAEILYWIEQLDFEWIDCGKLINYIKQHYIRSAYHVVYEFVECMEWKVDIDFLNHKMICEADTDYEYLGDDMYLNVYRLEDDELELKRLNLIK